MPQQHRPGCYRHQADLRVEKGGAGGILCRALSPGTLGRRMRLVDTQLTTSTTTAQERCMDGFRTGAKFMLGILVGESENLAPLVQAEL
ncbi:hypothetical protein [Anaerotruncus sp. 1XD42-93]|uniref:hypothetical protein n=1 Tax=Anaerotruncus sp. 1XD42-93 TaxID=2320853 RepID=UPI001A9B03BC|nr:hypothetical protein [Anaerotruncus sp. 1XD42-93]